MVNKIKSVLSAWSIYDCNSIAASIAYAAAVSLFPLLSLLVAVFGVFLEKGQIKSSLLESIHQISPPLSEALEPILTSLSRDLGVHGPISLVGLIAGSTLVFTIVDKAFLIIWDKRRSPEGASVWHSARKMVFSRLRSLLILAGIGMLAFLSLTAGIAARFVNHFSNRYLHWEKLPAMTGAVVAMFLTFIIFFFLYRFLSKEKVSSRLCLKAALVTTLLWEVGSQLMIMISFDQNYSAYGVIGSFLALIVWIYYNSMVFLVGALFIRTEFPQPARN